MWVGEDWTEDPSKPHSCPEGAVCLKPDYPGARIGETAVTGCVASEPAGANDAGQPTGGRDLT